jgi:integrase
MGRLYQRGKIWWLQYYRGGKLFRESSRSELKSVASTLLKKREGDIVDGRLPSRQAEKTTFEDLKALYLQDLEVNRPGAVSRVITILNHFSKQFSGLRAMEITTQRIGEHIARRRAKGISNGTLNRELKVLGRMFRLAARQTPPLVLALPYIPHLREDNVRTGFLEHDGYLALRAALPDHQKVPLSIGYWTGMRRGEILTLRWEQINLQRNVLRLEPGTTKNKKGRTVPLMGDLPDVLSQWRRETLLRWPSCPWVCHYEGQRLTRLTRAWETACERVGLKGKLFHDLRRTAIRNMVRAGIPERVAMMISGHQTRSVFDRYDIVNERDLFEAAVRLKTYFQGLTPDPWDDTIQPKPASDEHTCEHNPGTVNGNPQISI